MALSITGPMLLPGARNWQLSYHNGTISMNGTAHFKKCKQLFECQHRTGHIRH
jgi:hypothetical protein